MTAFIFGLIVGGSLGFLLAALLGAAAHNQHASDLEVAYRDGYLACMDHHQPGKGDFEHGRL